MNKINSQINITAYLLSFIFCGAIIGETVSLSIIVSVLGPTTISKLYLINGLALFCLPVFFFKYIDSVNREKMLEMQLIIISIILFVLFIVNTNCKNKELNKYILLGLYPLSYLSKTTLLLTFWTLANDIFPTNEAKKAFPLISAWGFIGGITGAVSARILLEIVKAESVISLWMISYIVAYFFVKRIKNTFRIRLLQKEDAHVIRKQKVFGNRIDIVTKKLIKLIAIFYFFVFLAIFSIDFLFWKVCHDWFITSESIASFQFSFYLIHAIVTIIGLKLILPVIIEKNGFSKILYYLPAVIVSGAIVLLISKYFHSKKMILYIFVSVQFIRYIVFENAFSPVFQMLFTVIGKEMRGRVKTILDGMVKPAAIIISGLLILLFKNNINIILITTLTSGVILIIVSYFIRQWYTKALIPESKNYLHYQDLITEIGSYKGQQLYSLIKKYEESEDTDMRIVAIKFLAGIESNQALEGLVRMFDKEKVLKLKEMIARSLSNHYGYQTKKFIEKLLKENNSRIKANAIYSINNMNCNWKRHLKPSIRKIIYVNNIRVQIEAAIYLWNNGDQHDRTNITDFLNSLLDSCNPNRRSAGIYLLGSLKLTGWEKLLIENLNSASIQLFTKSVDVLMKQTQSDDIRIEALNKISLMERKYIEIAGNIIKSNGCGLWEILVEYFPHVKSKRMAFEIIYLLRNMADEKRKSGKKYKIKYETAEEIKKWLINELELAYKDGYVWYKINNKNTEDNCNILDEALRENQIRICEWVVNGLVLLDVKGFLKWNYKDLDIRDDLQRYYLIEIIESISYQRIVSLLLPLLKMQSWDIIAKIGKGQFKLNERFLKCDITYFMLSDNRWVRLCSLFTLSKNIRKKIIKNDVKEALLMLSGDKNKSVSSMARDILEQNETARKRSTTFEMLERVLFFKKVPLYKKVVAENILKLAEIAEEVKYPKGAIISKEGEISDNLFIVKKGVLKIIKSTGGEVKIVAMIGECETYGELGLFSKTARSASAIAEKDCELYVIKRTEFKKLILKMPEVAFNLLEVVSERLRISAEELAVLKKSVYRKSESEFEQAL